MMHVLSLLTYMYSVCLGLPRCMTFVDRYGVCLVFDNVWCFNIQSIPLITNSQRISLYNKSLSKNTFWTIENFCL